MSSSPEARSGGRKPPPARGPLAGLRTFRDRYGWRAYALPALVAVTLLALVEPGSLLGHSSSAAASTSRSTAPSPTSASRPPSTASRPTAASQPTATPSTAAHTLIGPATSGAPPVMLAVDSTPCATNSQGQFVLVSISAQRIWMCQNTTQVYSSLVTTGAANVGDGTPLGTWNIQDKQTDRYLVGPGYRDYVHWWMPFNGDFGFHDAPWQTMAYGAPGYRDNGSHGCVHLPATAMAWFFNWASTGATVTIQA